MRNLLNLVPPAARATQDLDFGFNDTQVLTQKRWVLAYAPAQFLDDWIIVEGFFSMMNPVPLDCQGLN